MSQIKIGAVLNWTRVIMSMGIGFLLSPFILSHLGRAEFGIYSIAGTIVGWLAMCDFGLTASTTKFISEYQARNDAEGEAHYLGNVAALFSCIGVVVLLLGLGIYPFLGNIFDKFTEEELGIYKVLYLMTLFNTAFMFPTRALSGISAARQKYIVPGIVVLITSVLNTIIIVVVLHMGYKSIVLMSCNIFFGVLCLAWNVYYCFGMLKARMSWNGWDFPLCRAMFAFSFWMFLDQLINIFNNGCGNVIMGMTCGANDIAVYSYGQHMMNIYFSATCCVAGLFLPRVVKVVQTSNDSQELTRMWIRVGRVQIMLMGIMLSGVLFFGRTFFHLWIGDTMGDSTDVSWLVAVMLMAAITIPESQCLGWQILQARNVMRLRVQVMFVVALCGLILGYVLASYFGAVGLAVATMISVLVGQVGFMNYQYKTKVGLDVKRFACECAEGLFIPALLSAAVGYGLSLVLTAHQSWWSFVAVAGVYSLVYGVLFLNFYARRDEQNMLPTALTRFLCFRKDK